MKDIEVGSLIGKSRAFDVYLGTMNNGLDDEGVPVMLKVAKTFEDNDILLNESKFFSRLRYLEFEISASEEAMCKPKAHFDWLFVHQIRSCLDPEMGDRRINVYIIHDVDFSELVPLAKLFRDIEIDARTSVWILGRFLKLYNFFELIGEMRGVFPRYPIFRPGDYLISPKKHRLILNNFPGNADEDVSAETYLKAIARFMLETTVSEDEKDETYLEFLRKLAETGRKSPKVAHKELYRLVDKVWGIEFHPFTYRNRGSLVWKKIQ